ncbi:MAG: peptidoglycan DD-metalloendopeptidase family protein [Alphaproteobacteria bacterium]|nr:peptidoglycan DD-metalloendopeptidase family protein [Alphaproteobacteria bacterium]
MARNGLAFALLSVTGSCAFAQTQDPATELGHVQQSLKDSAERQSNLAANIDEAVKAETEISSKLVALGKTLDAQQQAMATADAKINQLTAEAVVIRSTLAEKQDRLSTLLAGLQRLEQNPPPALVVEPANILQALRGAMMFGAVVPQMRDEAQELQNNLKRLDAIKSETENTKTVQETARISLAATQLELIKLQAEKKSLAESSAKDLESERKKSAELAKKAETLQQLLAAIETEKQRLDAQKTAEVKAAELAKAEAERKAREALLGPPKLMSQVKGQLDYPVQGQILKNFGEDNGLGQNLDGVALATSDNAAVISPVDAKVEFAGPFRSYGQLLILNAGEGYLVLLAGMNHISADIGQSTRAGEPLGTMGKGPTSVALIGSDTKSAHPVLYVEFRKNNVPVDPSPWWSQRRKEAMK